MLECRVWPQHPKLVEVAEAVPSLNIMLCNIPIFTGVNLDPATVGRLSRVHNIVAIKEAAELNPKQITAFLNATPEDFIIYNGDDTMILEAYAQGGSARIGEVVSGAAHLVGPHIRKMIDTFLAGNIAEACRHAAQTLPALESHGAERTNKSRLPVEGGSKALGR